MDLFSAILDLAIIISLGVCCKIVAKMYRLPTSLLLIASGIILRIFFDFFKAELLPANFIELLSMFALAILIFESALKIRHREFDDFYISALKFTGLAFILTFIALSPVIDYLFSINFISASIFAALVCGTSLPVLSPLFKNSKNEINKFLTIESMFNTIIVLLVPFILFDLTSSFNTSFTTFLEFRMLLSPFLEKMIIGIGAGFIIGLLIVKLLNRHYLKTKSHLAFLFFSFIAYLLADRLEGQGIYAVAVVGIMFGNIVIKQKTQLHEYTSIISNVFESILFILLGYMVNLEFNIFMFVYSFLIFVAYIVLRYIALWLVLKSPHYTQEERKVAVILSPKGLPTAIVIIVLISKGSLPTITTLAFLVMVYSIIVSAYSLNESKKILKTAV